MTNRPVDTDADGGHWQTRGRTTIEPRRNGRGEWLASQRGVDAVGRGPSAAAAAATYCRAIESRVD